MAKFITEKTKFELVGDRCRFVLPNGLGEFILPMELVLEQLDELNRLVADYRSRRPHSTN